MTSRESTEQFGSASSTASETTTTREPSITSDPATTTGQPTTTEPTDQTETTLDRPGWWKSVSAHGREIVSTVVELAGIGVLSAGFWLIRPWAGLIVLGAGLILLGFAASPRFDRR